MRTSRCRRLFLACLLGDSLWTMCWCFDNYANFSRLHGCSPPSRFFLAFHHTSSLALALIKSISHFDKFTSGGPQRKIASNPEKLQREKHESSSPLEGKGAGGVQGDVTRRGRINAVADELFGCRFTTTRRDFRSSIRDESLHEADILPWRSENSPIGLSFPSRGLEMHAGPKSLHQLRVCWPFSAKLRLTDARVEIFRKIPSKNLPNRVHTQHKLLSSTHPRARVDETKVFPSPERQKPFFITLTADYIPPKNREKPENPPDEGLAHWNSAIRWHGRNVNKLWLLLSSVPATSSGNEEQKLLR